MILSGDVKVSKRRVRVGGAAKPPDPDFKTQDTREAGIRVPESIFGTWFGVRDARW
jgi:hypothetical protein